MNIVWNIMISITATTLICWGLYILMAITVVLTKTEKKLSLEIEKLQFEKERGWKS
jgi:hypothetical protein